MGDNCVEVFRAVDCTELADIRVHNSFRPAGTSVEGKYFAFSLADAATWGALLFPQSQFSVVRAIVPSEVAERAMYWPRLDAIGPAYFFDQDSLVDIVFVDIVKED